MNELDRSRLFLAVALDDETRALMAAHLAAHRAAAWPGKIVSPGNWHLTLRFLGWSTDVQRDQIMRSLDEADLPGPFRLRFGGLGAFPKPRRATVTWVGVTAGEAELERLADACDEAAQGAGFPPEDRPYHPHLTLSRVRPPVDARSLIEGFPPFDARMEVGRITVFHSHLEPGGARYEAIDTIEL